MELRRACLVSQHMKRPVHCTDQEEPPVHIPKGCASYAKWRSNITNAKTRPSSITKYCTCHEKSRYDLQSKLHEASLMADDSRMIRPCWDRPFAELTSPPWATHFWVSPKLQVCNHQMLRLPQKVARQHHQILRLPCKATFQHHQVATVTKRSHYDTMPEDSRLIRPCSDHIRP